MNKLQNLRHAAGLSQSQLAEKSGVNLRTIQGYESDRKDITKAAVMTVYNLAVAMGCKIENVIEVEELETVVRD